MVIWFLYTAIFVIALLGMYLSSLNPSPSRLDKVIRAFFVLVSIHIVHAALFRDVFLGLKYVDRGAPFGLLYGPLLYFAYRTAHRKALSLKVIILHVLPFILGLAAYGIFIIFYEFRMEYTQAYYVALYGLMALSWMVYPMVVILSGGRTHTISSWIYRYAIVVLLILAAFMLPLVIEGTARGERAVSPTSGFVIFFSMLIGVCLAYFHQLNQIVRTKSVTAELSDKEEQLPSENCTDVGIADTTKFKKYYGRIEAYMAHERYLDPEFTISAMLQELRLPKPVVVSFFASEYQGNIKQAINALRIKRACVLLEGERLEFSMEELASKCGFNSRASFYRNFSQEKNCTPLEYRDACLLKIRRHEMY